MICQQCQREVPDDEVMLYTTVRSMWGGRSNALICKDCGKWKISQGIPRPCVVCGKSIVVGLGIRHRRYHTCGSYRCEYLARKPAVVHEIQPCDHCGEDFMPKRSDSRFCSVRCRVASHRAGKRDGNG